ncbi:hypothetical protein EDB92DRAFT_1230885 [Lactarius akahatsu]|uniref:Uncharacterized protein n=1 Tax=Lactarius akahatsu TaxID=416441 RepID=A0AAD4LEL6_9AGAM|nr:hypothetical protein EDB92DRAFT_1230885 [Lactarius akahatsu]
MAAAQILRLTHSVDDRVKVVDDKVTGVHYKLKDVDDKMDIVLNDGIAVLDDMKWNQLKDNLRRWVTPPDPSTNHNIACDIHHGETTAWFVQGNIFAEWKSTGSLLWIYGKRRFSPLIPDRPLITVCVHSRLGQEHPLFYDHPRHCELTRGGLSLDGLLLFRLQGPS